MSPVRTRPAPDPTHLPVPGTPDRAPRESACPAWSPSRPPLPHCSFALHAGHRARAAHWQSTQPNKPPVPIQSPGVKTNQKIAQRNRPFQTWPAPGKKRESVPGIPGFFVAMLASLIPILYHCFYQVTRPRAELFRSLQVAATLATSLLCGPRRLVTQQASQDLLRKTDACAGDLLQ